MEKTFLLIVIITICNLTTSAQIEKGSIYLGADLSASSRKMDYGTSQPDQKNNYAAFNISAGWFVKKNMVIGVYGGYGHYNSTNNYTGAGSYDDSKADYYNAGLFARQYKKLAKDFYFFGELGTGYRGAVQKDLSTPGNIETKYTENGGELYVTPGVSYRIYKKLNVELLVPRVFGIQYSVRKGTSPGTNTTENRFGVSTNLNSSIWNSLGLGFRLII